MKSFAAALRIGLTLLALTLGSTFTLLFLPQGPSTAKASVSGTHCLMQYGVDGDTGGLVVRDEEHLSPDSLPVTRIWRQGSSGGLMFGTGWRFSGESLLERRSDSIQVRTGDGRCLLFELPDAQGEAGDFASYDCLFSQDGSFLDIGETEAVLQDGATGLKWYYEMAPDGLSGSLTAYDNPEWGRVSVGYSPDGSILFVADGRGHRIDFESDGAGRCLHAISQDGATANYTYDDAGRLSEVRTSQGDHRIYRYDGAGDLIEVECQGKVVAVRYSGTGSNKHCTAVVEKNASGTGSVTPRKQSAAPNIVVKPTSLAFGKVAVGKKVALALKITNKGTAVLKVNKISISGPQAAEFKIAAFAAISLKPGKSGSVSISFKPAASGLRKATLAVSSNDPDTPSLKVPLSGTGSAPPELLAINGPGAADDSGKIGAVISLTGRRFSPIARENEVSFNGIITTASAVKKDPGDATKQILTVTVPAGATSGNLTVRWPGSHPSPSNALVFTVLPTASLVLEAGMEAGGIYNGAYLYSIGWDYTEPHHCWVLGGSGFSMVNKPYLVITFPSGGFKIKNVFAFDDTRIFTDSLQRAFWDGQTMTHPPGEILTLRVQGQDKDTGLTVASNQIQIPITDHYIPGATWSLDATLPWPKMIVSRGDFVVIKGGGGSRQVLRSPDLWTGALPVNGTSEWDYSVTPEGVYAKVLRLDKAGDFTISNETNGKTFTLTVKNEGVPSDAFWATDECVNGTLAAERGAVLGFGGGRIIVPPGALPVHDGSPFYQICGRHRTSANDPFDTVLTDGGHTFKVQFSNFPEELLQPVTLSLPYIPSAGIADPELGIFNSETGIFVTFVSTVDREKNRVSCVIPAGRYAPPEASGPVQEAMMGAHPGPKQYQTWGMFGLYLNTLLENVSPVFYQAAYDYYYDFGRGLYMDVIIDPANPNFVTQELADLVWETMLQTYDFLESEGWRIPWYLLHWSIRDLGAYQCNTGIGTGGATTAGVWGQPWTYINPMIGACDATTTRHVVTHEMAHSFQRQYTTTIARYWIDEATSQWVSFAMNGVTPELKMDVTQGSEFPARMLPAAFLGGYNDREAYAAGALAIWLERYYPGFLLNLYRAAGVNGDILFDAHGQLLAWTGIETISKFVDTFAIDYWTQYFDPVTGTVLNDTSIVIADWTGGTTGPTFSAPLSSMRYSCGATGQFRPKLEGRDLVVRATKFENRDQYIYVYTDTNRYSLPPGNMQLVKTLSMDFPDHCLGEVKSGIQSWRFIRANLHETEPQTTELRIVSPHIESLSPNTGSARGGYSVTINGVGFGDTAGDSGRVLVAGVEGVISSFSDTSVTFTMPNVAGISGTWNNVLLYTRESARSNYGSFTYTP